MYPTVCVFFVIIGCAFCTESELCLTPNGENGTCIPVNACRPIKQAIMYFNKDGIEFAKASQCGDEEGPLVCCGSAGGFTSAPSLVPSTTVPSIQIQLPSAIPINHLLLPDRSLCGLQVPENRPVTKPVEAMEFPWMAALKYTKSDGSPGGFRCAGTLINERYVLTAAQCLTIPGYDLTSVRLGEWKFSAPTKCIESPYDDAQCEYPVVELRVSEKIAHPYYNNNSGNNDIAIVRLEERVKYTDFVRPICLPPSDYYPPPPGTPMETSGWALTGNGSQSDIKLKQELLMVGPEDCNKVFPNFVQYNPNKACIKSKAANLCNGDSGSPLMRSYDKEDANDQDQKFQEGIIYKGVGCGPSGQPALYMRVSRYIQWILTHLNP